MKFNLLTASIMASLVLIPALSAEAKEATLVFCSEGGPESFNPQLGTAGTTFDASATPIYNRLVEFSPGSTETKPGLAESWTISPDGLVYTFKLRQNVKWQTTKDFTPTRNFNADDVVFSFERMWKEDNAYHKVSGGTYTYFAETSMPDVLKSIEKVDDNTVRITLNAPNSPFTNILALYSFSILSKEYADQMLKAGTPEKLDTNPVGTGPFVLVDYVKDSTIRYKANKDYWKGAPKFDNLVFSITTDAATRASKIEKGECHVMAYPNAADLPKLKADKNLKVLQQEGFNVAYLGFNVEKKPFNDKKVRQALNMAIDKTNLIKAVYLGAATPAVNPIPPTLWSYNKQVKDYSYDPAKAKKLLEEAGYKDGFETTLWYMPVVRPYNPNGQKMAEAMQADLAKVGVKVKLVTYEWKEYLKRQREGEHDMLQLGWTGDYPDPDNFLNTLLSCDAAKTSTSRWCDKNFDDLVVKARQVSDVKERTKLYEEAQKVFKEEAPWFTVAHSIVNEITRANVEGYKMSPLGSHDFQEVSLK
ncbi:MAG: ABC transporter substrate-binding protein [Alphaproteobacteria bacterium]|nr:ABC transporter substrate-binding protein [Alphaproteobacteria bacterium]